MNFTVRRCVEGQVRYEDKVPKIRIFARVRRYPPQRQALPAIHSHRASPSDAPVDCAAGPGVAYTPV